MRATPRTIRFAALGLTTLAATVSLAACGTKHNASVTSSSSSPGASGASTVCTPVAGSQLVTLTDDKKLQLSDNITPVVRTAVNKEPLTDAAHVRTALARFDQVQDVSDADRDLAFANIKKAAEQYGVAMTETSWRDLGKKPHTRNPHHS